MIVESKTASGMPIYKSYIICIYLFLHDINVYHVKVG